MMEAKIVCTCTRIQIADLDMLLTQGMTIYMDAGKARASVDVQRAWRNKAVTLQYVERFQERRPAQPSANPVFPEPAGMAAFTASNQRDESVLFDPDDIADRVVAAFAGSPVTEKIRIEVGRQLAGVRKAIVNDVVTALKAEIAAGIRVEGVQMSPVVGSHAPAGRVLVEDDAPVFVPSKIGRDDLVGDIGVKATKVEGATGVSDAADALRELKRGAKAGKKR